MVAIKLIKVKNRNRCWGASFRESLLELLDIRDVEKDRILFSYDEESDTLIVRLSTEIEGKGSPIRHPHKGANLYLSNFALPESIKEGDYYLNDKYQEGDFEYHEFILNE